MNKKDYTVPDTYSDMDGNTRTFTHIDCDKKLAVVVSLEDKDKISKELVDYRYKLLERIISVSASLCPDAFHMFTLRGEQRKNVGWDEGILALETTEKLRNLCVLLEKRNNK